MRKSHPQSNKDDHLYSSFSEIREKLKKDNQSYSNRHREFSITVDQAINSFNQIIKQMFQENKKLKSLNIYLKDRLLRMDPQQIVPIRRYEEYLDDEYPSYEQYSDFTNPFPQFNPYSHPNSENHTSFQDREEYSGRGRPRGIPNILKVRKNKNQLSALQSAMTVEERNQYRMGLNEEGSMVKYFVQKELVPQLLFEDGSEEREIPKILLAHAYINWNKQNKRLMKNTNPTLILKFITTYLRQIFPTLKTNYRYYEGLKFRDNAALKQNLLFQCVKLEDTDEGEQGQLKTEQKEDNKDGNIDFEDELWDEDHLNQDNSKLQKQMGKDLVGELQFNSQSGDSN